MKKQLNFEAKDVQLRDILFTNYKKFKIPRYQRPYSWGEDHVSDLWNDLISDDTNFIGSLIFNTEHQERSGYYEIIDGQQRLLTITIFCAVLRDIIGEIDHKKADIFHRHDIVIEDSEGNYKNRIKCGETLESFFVKNIQNDKTKILESDPKSKEEKLVKQNYAYFHDMISTQLKTFTENSKKLDYLQNLRNKVHSLPVIQIEVRSEDEAYDIFETTNARGIDLSVADLLKNMIFSNLRETEEKDIAKESWNDIVANVQDTDTELKKFIRYFWISKYSFVPEKKLYKTIKSTIVDWEELLRDLHEASKWYEKLFASTPDPWEDVSSGNHIFKSLRALRIMNVSQCYVLFLSILRNLDKLGTDPRRVFKLVENFSFKYSAICKLPGNKPEKIYSRYALEIEKAAASEGDKKNIHKKIQQIFEEFKKVLQEEEPGFEQFREAFSEVSYSRSDKNRLLCKYILDQINILEQPSELDFTTVNLEHILPQKPDKEWGLKPKDIKSYVHKIGNLTLVSKKINSTVQNKIVKEKIAELSKSGVHMTIKLVEHLKESRYKWDEEAINKRHDELAKIGYIDVWKIE